MIEMATQGLRMNAVLRLLGRILRVLTASAALSTQRKLDDGSPPFLDRFPYERVRSSCSMHERRERDVDSVGVPLPIA
jgi:hypothetical protein